MPYNLRVALRSLLKSPGFFATAVMSLALAIGASAAAFSVVDAVRFRALPFANADRLVVLGEITNAPGAQNAKSCDGACTVSYRTYSEVLRDYKFRTIDAIIASTSGGKALRRGDDVIPVSGGVITHNTFAMLDVRPLVGRGLLPADDALGVPLVTVLSHELWTTQFASDPTVIGRAIKLSDSQYTIVGIMPPGFDFESGAQFWLPAVPTLDPSTKPSITEVSVFARLAPGYTIEQFRAEIAGIAPVVTAKEASNAKSHLVADPLRARYASSTQSHDLAFAAIVACVLLIACTNLANLILVRALHQQREFGIRSALGANTRRLLQPVLWQNGIIVATATVIGTALASVALGVLRALPVLTSLRPTGMEYRMDWRVIAFTLAIAIVAALIISLVPAKLATRGDLAQLIRGARGVGGSAHDGWTQRIFVVSQIACATVLLSGTLLMTRSVINASRVQLGFDYTHVVTATPSFPHGWRQPNMYMPVVENILAATRDLPGVTSVAARASTPFVSRSGSTAVTPDGASSPLASSLLPPSALSVSPGYFATMGVRVLAGREFGEEDRDSSVAVAIINAWAASHWWPKESAVGRTIRIEQGKGKPVVLTIVGVVADNKAARPNLLLALDGAELYRPYQQLPSAFPSFFARASGRAQSLLKPLREVMVRLVPDRPVGSTLLAQRVDQQLSGVRSNTMQIAAFAVVGLMLAVIGVYGVLTYDVNRRTREIGIRSALGASRLQSAQTVLTNALILSAIGAAIGVPVALAASRLISSLLFRTDTGDPAVYASVVGCILLVSLLAALAPARRATRVDPMVALRTE